MSGAGCRGALIAATVCAVLMVLSMTLGSVSQGTLAVSVDHLPRIGGRPLGLATSPAPLVSSLNDQTASRGVPSGSGWASTLETPPSMAAVSPAADPNTGLAPNQIDLGMSVVNLTILDINDIDKGDLYGPYYNLEVTFDTFDPETGSSVSSSTNWGENQGCAGMWSCGVFPYAVASSETSSISFTLTDNQQGYGGCDCYVNIAGSSATYTIDISAPLQSNTIVNGQACTVTTPCGYTTSGSSGSREASVEFVLTVETATLSESAGRQSVYGAFQTYFDAIAGGVTSIVCPTASQLDAPFTSEQLATVLTAVFAIMTLGVGTAATLAVDDVMLEWAETVLDLGNTAFEAVEENWGAWTASTYPSDIAAINDLASANDLSAVGCATLIYFWIDYTSYFSSDESTYLSDLGTVVSDNAAVTTALEGGSANSVITKMNAEQTALSNAQSVGSTYVSDLATLETGGGNSINCNGILSGCNSAASWVSSNLVQPLDSVFSDDHSIIAEDIYTIQQDQSNLGVAGCEFPSFLEPGQSFSTTLEATGGIAPNVLSFSGASWMQVSSTGSDQFQLSGTAPATPGSYTGTVHAYDNAGDTGSSCTGVVQVGLTPTLSISPTSAGGGQSVSFGVSISGGPGGTYEYSYSGLPPGCSNNRDPTLTCYPTMKGTYSVTATVIDENDVSFTSAPVSLTITSNAVQYSVTFSETGLPSGDTWSATLGSSQQFASAGTSISFSATNGPYSWAIGEVAVSNNGCVAVYWAATPQSGTATVNGGSLTYSVTYTEQTSTDLPVHGALPIERCTTNSVTPTGKVGSAGFATVALLTLAPWAVRRRL
jgi:hypothetical protein